MATVKLKLELIGYREGKNCSLAHEMVKGAITFNAGTAELEIEADKVKEFQATWPHGYDFVTTAVLTGDGNGVLLAEPDKDEMLKFKELSDKTGVTHKQLATWVKEGKLNTVKKAKGSAEFVYYSLRSVENLLAAEGGEL